jgi:hypothetical protein
MREGGSEFTRCCPHSGSAAHLRGVGAAIEKPKHPQWFLDEVDFT